ncbi:MAG: hypothetical protein CMC70_02375 [Flavobacteriaceae bacterium]|mgnify:CR=1 FL=1|nr:hypothetical protein [Flavobacteriaceae bacterium]
MKKIYILAAMLAFGFGATAQIDYEEDFEFFNLGDVSPQHPNWRTWGQPAGPNENAQIVDTQAASGTQSLEINEEAAPAGIDQIMLVTGNPSSGTYSLKFNMFVPAGREGYFNMQGDLTPDGTTWVQHLNGGNVYFNELNGSPGEGTVDGTPGQTFTFPHDTWFAVDLVYDLDGETWNMYIDGTNVFDAPQEFTFNQDFVSLAALDLYAPSANTLYYIDDMIHFNGDSTTLSTEDFTAANFSVYPNPVQDRLNIQSTNAVDAITVYDVLGKVVLSATPGIVSPSIDMSNLTSGAYLVNVTINGSSKTVKVVK